MSVPSQNNPPIKPNYFKPSKFNITDIVRGKTTVISMADNDAGGTPVAPNYVIGQLIRVVMSSPHGMRQINNEVGYVLSIPSGSSVEVGIDSSLYDAFTEVVTGCNSPAQIVAVGDINSGAINSNGQVNNLTYIPGAFINISRSLS